MDYLWDTNILLHRIRRSERFEAINHEHHFQEKGNRVFLSVVNIGEIESIAFQRNWREAKWNELSSIIKGISLLEIYEEVIHAYAQIDAYSQGKLPNRPLPPGVSSRNMGKNDLWLAATAHIGNLTFVTTDQDFAHLDGDFIQLLKV